VTWTAGDIYVADQSMQPAGTVNVYVDCKMVLDKANPRGSQSTAFGYVVYTIT